MKPRAMGSHHRAYEGKTNTWLTPPEVLKPLGHFDLDPCAAPEPRPWSTAKEMWTEGGLDKPWHGRVWLNPPYGPHAVHWLKKMSEYQRGIALTFARTETAWFQDYCFGAASWILFLRGRLHFHYPDGTRAPANAGAPSCLVGYGEESRTFYGLHGFFWTYRL